MTDWFFLLLINCYDFQKVQEKIIIDNTFVFIEYLRVMVMDTYFQTIQRCAFLYPIQPLKQQLFLICHSITITSSVIDCSDDRSKVMHIIVHYQIIKFKLQSAYSRVNFCGTSVCGDPFWWELLQFLGIAGKIPKISCHTAQSVQDFVTSKSHSKMFIMQE